MRRTSGLTTTHMITVDIPQSVMVGIFRVSPSSWRLMALQALARCDVVSQGEVGRLNAAPSWPSFLIHSRLASIIVVYVYQQRQHEGVTTAMPAVHWSMGWFPKRHAPYLSGLEAAVSGSLGFTMYQQYTCTYMTIHTLPFPCTAYTQIPPRKMSNSRMSYRPSPTPTACIPMTQDTCQAIGTTRDLFRH